MRWERLGFERHTEHISKMHIYNTDAWINDIPLEWRRNNSSSGCQKKKALCGNSKIGQNMSKRPFFFLCAACFESEPGLKLRKTFNWAVVGFKKYWELSECEALVAASFSQSRDSSCLQILSGKWTHTGVSLTPPLGHEMRNLEFTSVIINPNICQLGWVSGLRMMEWSLTNSQHSERGFGKWSVKAIVVWNERSDNSAALSPVQISTRNRAGDDGKRVKDVKPPHSKSLRPVLTKLCPVPVSRQGNSECYITLHKNGENPSKQRAL